MKGTTIISVIVSLLFALVTTTEAFDPVLDYGTGKQIHRQDGLGARPSRVVQLVPVRAPDRNGEFVKTEVKCRVRFNDSTNYWNDLADSYRITETDIAPLDGGAFKFEETNKKRVYRMVYRFLNSDFYEVGMQVKTRNNEDKYYLATDRKRKELRLINEETLNQVRFTFEKL
ncbi:unnamed protein product [Arabis nemorensis]|uniref:Uncharacterized protein n=1 Tax=Arabis nemorensis TaxID=586526 RepID=A0A565BRA0_9BRAS|nr:unnamed protein product [Arabis nemorensis]